jgi:3-phenylpropionate/trans-cinnamate dioxygenase ferredoxin reductase subunit
VGAGFIGMEISASLRAYDVESVVVEAAERVWPRVLPPELAEWMQRVFEERGVRFRLGTGVEGFDGDGRVEAARAGDERLPCDFAVVGVGIVPNAEMAAEAGLLVSDGIQVDEMGETSHAGIYAAGDVARFPDPFGGGSVRVEHWDHAKEHGRAVGRNMAGAETPYRRLTYFFSDVFDLSLNVLGRLAAAQRLVQRGTPGEGPSIAFGVEDGHVTSAVMVNASKRLDACRALVAGRPAAEEIEDRLSDPDVSLEDLAETGDRGGDG